MHPDDLRELARSADPYLGRTLAARYRLIKRLGSDRELESKE